MDTAALFATIDAVKGARPRPSSSSSGLTTTGSAVPTAGARSTTFFGVGEERTHERSFTFDADHPAVLVGHDNGPAPVEFVLHSLAACLTAGLANIVAARKIRLTSVRCTISGDIDLNGILGLNPGRPQRLSGHHGAVHRTR